MDCTGLLSIAINNYLGQRLMGGGSELVTTPRLSFFPIWKGNYGILGSVLAYGALRAGIEAFNFLIFVSGGKPMAISLCLSACAFYLWVHLAAIVNGRLANIGVRSLIIRLSLITGVLVPDFMAGTSWSYRFTNPTESLLIASTGLLLLPLLVLPPNIFSVDRNVDAK